MGFKVQVSEINTAVISM